jgi:copper homeostasis protein (lipoprotein)
MKPWIFLALLPLCAACGNKAQAAAENDLMAEEELQTYQYEGLLSDENGEWEYQLTIQSVGLNEDGTYTSTTTYTLPEGGNEPIIDSGKKITLVGIPNDSTAVIYQLISNQGGENINFIVEGDSALTRVDREFKRLVNDLKQSIKRVQ